MNNAQAIKDRLDIVDVIAAHIDIKKTGSQYRAKCPFHDGKNLTMSIRQDKQFFNCFKCGAAGDLISFYKEYNNLSFPKALDELAKKAGIEVGEYEQLVPKKINEEYQLDKMIMIINQHDKENNKRISYTDKQRVKLAEQRSKNIENKYKKVLTI